MASVEEALQLKSPSTESALPLIDPSIAILNVDEVLKISEPMRVTWFPGATIVTNPPGKTKMSPLKFTFDELAIVIEVFTVSAPITPVQLVPLQTKTTTGTTGGGPIHESGHVLTLQ